MSVLANMNTDNLGMAIKVGEALTRHFRFFFFFFFD